jgi:hypothetical protein
MSPEANGGFVEERFGDPSQVTYGLAAGDLNRDGFPEIVITNSGSPNVLVFNTTR